MKKDTEHASNRASRHRGILIFAEQHEGIIAPAVFELLGKGRELSEALQEPLECILFGKDIIGRAKQLATYGVDSVHVIDHPALKYPMEEVYAQAVYQVVEEIRPSVLLIGATSLGKSLAPRIAAKLRAGLTGDCIDFDIDTDGNFIQVRPSYSFNVLATIICPHHRPQIATVRSRAMERAEPILERECKIVEHEFDPGELSEIKQIVEFRKEVETVSLVDADVVISGGKGLGNSEGFSILRDLAEELNGAVGASRAAVDEGWIGYTHQVGLSGRTVRPKLYVACGISGAIQHLAGIRSSEVVVAINKDPSAPIFKYATIGIVGDVYDVIPKLINRIREIKNRLHSHSG
ncbi:MAG: electron transfer flavoprotein subunit alpha/FixB family protein [Candidatus Bathyarchaeia archaeon]